MKTTLNKKAINKYYTPMEAYRFGYNDVNGYIDDYTDDYDANCLDDLQEHTFDLGVQTVELRAKYMQPAGMEHQRTEYELIRENGLEVNCIGNELQFLVNPQKFYFDDPSNALYIGQKVDKQDLRTHLENLVSNLDGIVRMETLSIHSIDYAFYLHCSTPDLVDEYIELAYLSRLPHLCAQAKLYKGTRRSANMLLKHKRLGSIPFALSATEVGEESILRFVMTVPRGSARYAKKSKAINALNETITKEAQISYTYINTAFECMLFLGSIHCSYENAINVVSTIGDEQVEAPMNYLLMEAQNCDCLYDALQNTKQKFNLSEQDIAHIFDSISTLLISPLTMRHNLEYRSIVSLNNLLGIAYNLQIDKLSSID